MNLLGAFQHVMQRRDLDEAQARDAMLELMGGAAAPELVAGFIVAITAKGETVPELTGFARAMREKSIRIQPRVPGRLVDTCGTGGAPVKCFNISTGAAFVAAAAGVPIAKHGNKSATRPSGSADVLAALGAQTQLPPETVQRVIEEVGIGFLLAPRFHPAVKNAAPTRAALQIRTVFNLLGPITNPAGAQGQVLGVYAREYVRPVADVLQRLGTQHALVVHGDGMDEASLAASTVACEVRPDAVRDLTLEGAHYGYAKYRTQDWAPLSPADSAREIRRILSGRADGPRRDILEYNAGLAVYVGGRAPTIDAGIERARSILDSNDALAKLDEFVDATQRAGANPS